MSADAGRRPSVGASVEDLCRACKMLRRHTVVAADETRILRVVCDYCGSQHNYRGAKRASPARPTSDREGAEAFPLVTERERRYPAMAQTESDLSTGDLELLLRRVIREESGLTPVAPAERWRGGQLVLRPAREELQEKSWPIETFFHKVVMLRNRLRTMEQQINAAELPADVKLKLQGHVTACYGTLTSFNVLFAEEGERFRGSGGKKPPEAD